jgi:uncharacterized protein
MHIAGHYTAAKVYCKGIAGRRGPGYNPAEQTGLVSGGAGMPTIKDIVIRKPSPAQVAEAKKWPIWEHAAESFEWFYTQGEKCLILEGKVTIKSMDGKDSVSFAAGDWVEFPNGLSCIWDIKQAVRKHYNFE